MEARPSNPRPQVLQPGSCRGENPFAREDPRCDLTGAFVSCPNGPDADAAATCHARCVEQLGAENVAGVELMAHYSTCHPGKCHCCCAKQCDCFDNAGFGISFAAFPAGGGETERCPAPTMAPTDQPTAEPTDECEDVEGWMVKPDESSGHRGGQTCLWVAEDSETRCEEAMGNGNILALDACCVCKEFRDGRLKCEDNALWTNSNGKGCSFIAEKAEKRCRGDALYKCRKTCETCPACGEDCCDSMSFRLKGKKHKDCNWVAERPDVRCRDDALYDCPTTCATCSGHQAGPACDGDCCDSASFQHNGKETRDCAWIGERADVRCENNPQAQRDCPAACGTCPHACDADSTSWYHKIPSRDCERGAGAERLFSRLECDPRRPVRADAP